MPPHVSLSSMCLPRPWEGHLTHAQVTGGTPDILTDNERDICHMHRLWGEHPVFAQAREGTPGTLTGLSNEKPCEGGQMHVLC